MIALSLILLAVLGLLVLCLFVLGFRLGGNHWQEELMRVRAESARASREMGDLTRQAFVAMAEQAEKLRRRQF